MNAHTFVEPHLRVVCVCGVERSFRLFPASTACSLLVQEVRAETVSMVTGAGCWLSYGGVRW